MKKLVFLLTFAIVMMGLAVSCGHAEAITTSPINSSATAPETTKPILETTTTTVVTTVVAETAETTPTQTIATTIPITTKSPEITTQPETTVYLPETTAAPITYTAKSWMGALPDDMLLTNVAMPGTHDSGATINYKLFGFEVSGTAKCQELTIAEQLAIGVRFFDIRLRRVNGELHIYHGDVDQKLNFDEVLSACYAFLAENPSETLMMCIKEETDASGTNAAFDTMVAAKINANSSYWHTSPVVPLLGTVRGKIVLMRRYATSGNFGINAASGWSDNTTFSLNAGNCILSVQDYYNDESADAKWSAISAMFNKMKYQKSTYYLNYTSGYKSSGSIPNINTIKDSVNPKLIDYLKTSPDFVGIVVTDFMTAEIAELIYKVNFR